MAVGRETALAQMPKPPSATSSEAFEGPIGIEDFDARVRHGMDVEEGVKFFVRTVGAHAATSVGPASASPRK